jgi:hypothetical protein
MYIYIYIFMNILMCTTGPHRAIPLLAAIEKKDLNIVQLLLHTSKHAITKNEVVEENIGITGEKYSLIIGDSSGRGTIYIYIHVYTNIDIIYIYTCVHICIHSGNKSGW